MPYKENYAKLTEEQKEVERARARLWHKNNYEKIKERKQNQANKYYVVTGKAKYIEGCKLPAYKLQRILQAAKTRSKKHAVIFDLTLEEVKEMYIAQNGKCALSGREFDFSTSGTSSPKANAMSLDRIIPSLGYTKTNVRIVVHHLNMAMSNFGLDELKLLLKDVERNSER